MTLNPLSAVLSPLAGRSPKKILMYYPDFGFFGGIERFILHLCMLLKQTGEFEPLIACSAGTPFYRQACEQGLTVYGISTLPIFIKNALRFLDVFTYIRLKTILDKEKPDLVHIHAGQMENLLFKWWGYPLIYTFHGYSTVFNIEATKNPLVKLLKHILRPGFRYFASRLDGLLFVSRAEQARMLAAKYLTTHAPGEVIHNSMDLRAFQNRIQQADPDAFKRKHGIPVEAPCISFVSRMDENKNPFQFIRLAEELSRQPEFTGFHFVMAGSGNLADAVQQAISISPIREKIHFLGHCDEVPELLAATELTVQIPTLEAFGLGVLEAMASGTLCVAYASGGILEVMDISEAACCLVPTGRFDLLLEKTAWLLKLPLEEKNRLIETFKVRALDFDQSVFLQKMLNIYRDILHKNESLTSVNVTERRTLARFQSKSE